MTNEEIRALDNQALNIAVAEKVMGWRWCVQLVGDISRPGRYEYFRFLADPDFSTGWKTKWDGETDIPIKQQFGPPPDFAGDIKWAKAATDAILKSGAYWDCHVHCYGAPLPDCLVVMINWTDAGRRVEGRAETEEKARARAALRAYWSTKE